MNWYRRVFPFVRLVNAEQAHGMAIKALKHGLVPRPPVFDPPILSQNLWGMTFANPVGLAAGFDKDAEVFGPMLDQGFGFVEVGSLTPEPQPGNSKPRLFRLTEDRAVINRMGFNNQGHVRASRRLREARSRKGPVGVNLGKNKISDNAVADYVAGVKTLGPVADYLVVNVSSPNTPGLRALQGRDSLRELLTAVLGARDALVDCRPPLLLKIAPDLEDEDQADIAAVAKAVHVDGLIISNTTIARPESLISRHRGETGGLSGQPLFETSTRLLGDFYKALGGSMPLIGVGGIGDADRAYRKIKAGASLLQLYSALIYEGPGLARTVKRGLVERLKADGARSVVDAIGADHR